jgi:hypothetical protein
MNRYELFDISVLAYGQAPKPLNLHDCLTDKLPAESQDDKNRKICEKASAVIKSLEDELRRIRFHPGNFETEEDPFWYPGSMHTMPSYWTCCKAYNRDDYGCQFLEGYTQERWDEPKRQQDFQKAIRDEASNNLRCKFCRNSNHRAQDCSARICIHCREVLVGYKHRCPALNCNKCGDHGHRAENCSEPVCPHCRTHNRTRHEYARVTYYNCSNCKQSFSIYDQWPHSDYPDTQNTQLSRRKFPKNAPYFNAPYANDLVDCFDDFIEEL